MRPPPKIVSLRTPEPLGLHVASLLRDLFVLWVQLRLACSSKAERRSRFLGSHGDTCALLQQPEEKTFELRSRKVPEFHKPRTRNLRYRFLTALAALAREGAQFHRGRVWSSMSCRSLGGPMCDIYIYICNSLVFLLF